MDDSEALAEVARRIRCHLPEILSDDPSELDRQIAEALAAARAGQDVRSRLFELLTSTPRLHAQTARMLDELSPGSASQESVHESIYKSYEPLPGAVQPVSAPRFSCPQCHDYVWYRPSVGSPVPTCPTCGVRLTAEHTAEH